MYDDVFLIIFFIFFSIVFMFFSSDLSLYFKLDLFLSKILLLLFFSIVVIVLSFCLMMLMLDNSLFVSWNEFGFLGVRLMGEEIFVLELWGFELVEDCCSL